jgi:hypothetical protein
MNHILWSGLLLGCTLDYAIIHFRRTPIPAERWGKRIAFYVLVVGGLVGAT